MNLLKTKTWSAVLITLSHPFANAQAPNIDWLTPGMSNPAWQLSQTADGNIMASVHGIAMFWKGADRQFVGSLNVDGLWGSITPNGQQFVSGQSSRIRFHQIASGLLLGDTGYLGGNIRDFELSSDGSLVGVACDTNNRLIVYDVATRSQRLSIPHPDAVYNLAISPDNQKIVTGCRDANYRIWRVSDGALLATLPGEGHGQGLLFSPNGQFFASKGGSVGGVKLWNATTYLPIREFGVENSFNIAFYPDSQRVFVSRAGTFGGAYIANVASGVTEYAWNINEQLTSCPVLVAADGQRLFMGMGEGRKVRINTATTGAFVKNLGLHTGAVASVALSPDEQVAATASDDRTVRLWTLATGTPVGILQGHTGAVKGVAFSPTGSLIATGSMDDTVKLWRTSDFGLERTLTGHTNDVYAVAWHPAKPLIASASDDRTLRMWNIQTGALYASVALIPGDSGTLPRALAFSPNGKFLVALCLSRRISVFTASTLKRVSTTKLPVANPSCLAFSANGSVLAVGCDDNTIKLYAFHLGFLTPEPYMTLTGFTAGVKAVAFSADGTKIIGSEGSSNLSEMQKIRIYHANSGQLESSYDLETGSGVHGIAASRSAAWFIAGRADGVVMKVEF